MAITQIPPRDPLSPKPPLPREGSDLYNARHWESAYRQAGAEDVVPTLLLQLQDDLSRSRRREAFWMSVVVHMLAVVLVVNSPMLARFLPKRPVLIVPANDWLRQKELTYLEMPPDAQKVAKRPDANIISDKDRIATSRTPQLDPQELKQILDSARPGPPEPPASSVPPSPEVAEKASGQQAAPRPAPPQVAQLETPPLGAPRITFGSPAQSAGSAIEEAARAALADRGRYGGAGGDYGLGQGRQPSKAVGELDVLSDTMGVDFGPYLSRVLHDVRLNWYNLIPEVARAPLMKKGRVSIEFAILKDGRVAGMSLVSTSGDVALDRAAWGGITASNPFPPLPAEFAGQYLALRFHFFYNPDRTDLQ